MDNVKSNYLKFLESINMIDFDDYDSNYVDAVHSYFVCRISVNSDKLDELYNKYNLDDEDLKTDLMLLKKLSSLIKEIYDYFAFIGEIGFFTHYELDENYDKWEKAFNLLESDIDIFLKGLEEKHGKSMK